MTATNTLTILMTWRFRSAFPLNDSDEICVNCKYTSNSLNLIDSIYTLIAGGIMQLTCFTPLFGDLAQYFVRGSASKKQLRVVNIILDPCALFNVIVLQDLIHPISVLAIFIHKRKNHAPPLYPNQHTFTRCCMIDVYHCLSPLSLLNVIQRLWTIRAVLRRYLRHIERRANVNQLIKSHAFEFDCNWTTHLRKKREKEPRHFYWQCHTSKQVEWNTFQLNLC